MNKEECLRAQAAHNLPCFIHECPLHQTCLHWLTGQYYGSDFHVVTSVNPYYPNVNSLQCTLYQKNEIVTYAIGIKHIFDDIPYPIARIVKKRLIALFSRKRFYDVPFLQKTNSTLPVSSTKKVGMEKSATTIGKKIICGKNCKIILK